MNLGAARVVLRVRKTADILDLAAPFCLSGWRLLLPLAALVLLPAVAGCLAARAFLGWSWPAVWTAAVILGALAQAPFTIACGELLFHDARHINLASVLERCVRRLPSLVVVYLVTRLLHLLGAFIVMLVPFTAAVLLVVFEVVLLEGAGPFAAMVRSGRAVRGQGVSAFGVAAALFLLPVAGVFAGEVTGGALVTTVFQWGEPFESLWSSGGSPYALVGFFLTVPLVAAARFLKYIDLRTRKDGWDIQLRFMAMSSAMSSASASVPTPGRAVVTGTNKDAA